VTYLVDDLGSQLLGSAAEREGIFALDILLYETEVRDLGLAVGPQQHVFRLEVTLDDISRVHLLEHQHNLSHEELRFFFGEPLSVSFGDVPKELTALTEVGDQTQLLVVLERLLKLHYEWVAQRGHRVPLIFSPFNLF
jgi:hypothetical protein